MLWGLKMTRKALYNLSTFMCSDCDHKNVLAKEKHTLYNKWLPFLTLEKVHLMQYSMTSWRHWAACMTQHNLCILLYSRLNKYWTHYNFSIVNIFLNVMTFLRGREDLESISKKSIEFKKGQKLATLKSRYRITEQIMRSW